MQGCCGFVICVWLANGFFLTFLGELGLIFLGFI
jgi:hypothetical protein